MLLTITTTHPPATDLGYLLHKHPERVQAFDAVVRARRTSSTRRRPRSAARRRCCSTSTRSGWSAARRPASPRLDQYVNDRPYVASSFLSVAIVAVFGTALAGRCEERPELAEQPLPLEARLAVLPCRGGEAIAAPPVRAARLRGRRRRATRSTSVPGVGRRAATSRSTLRGEVPAARPARRTSTCSIPVLDDDKHYWVGDDEVEKLLRHGEGWLAAHPERELIVDALPQAPAAARARRARAAARRRGARPRRRGRGARDAEEEAVEEPMRLQRAAARRGRRGAARRAARSACSTSAAARASCCGALLRRAGVRARSSASTSRTARSRSPQRRLRLDRLPPRQRERIAAVPDGR